MARELPIFPLPLVLFPGVPLPLHIFEPRYRQLLADALDRDRRFGITYAAPSAGDPRPGETGCIAFIQTTQRLSDGRSNILTTGERRFVLERWVETDRPYGVGVVEEFDDGPDEPDTAALAAGVRREFTRLVNALAVLANRDVTPPPLPPEPGALSFQVAAALELEPGLKQALLETRSSGARLRRLQGVLDSLAADATERAAVHRRGRGNGKGGAHPRIERTR
jgi:Lon protease-like protein